MTEKNNEDLAIPSSKRSRLLRRLETFTIAILTVLFLPTILAYLPITRAQIIQVVEEGPPPTPEPFELEQVGNDLVAVMSFTLTFKNKGLTAGRIDRVEPVIVGSAAPAPALVVRYFDRKPIRGLRTRDIKVEYTIRIPGQWYAAETKWARWELYLYDDSGNEVGSYGQEWSFGKGEIPDDPFPPDSLRP